METSATAMNPPAPTPENQQTAQTPLTTPIQQSQTNQGNQQTQPMPIDPALYELAYKAAKQKSYSEALGRFVDRDLGVKSIDEAKELIKYAKEHRAGTSTTATPPPSNDLKILADEKASLEKRLNDERSSYRAKVLQEGLKSSYLELGGIPNSDELKPAEQAVKLLMISEEFEVDDSYNVVCKNGLTINQKMELWLKQNPHFKRAGIPESKGPNLGNKPPVTPIPTDPMNVLNNFLAAGK